TPTPDTPPITHLARKEQIQSAGYIAFPHSPPTGRTSGRRSDPRILRENVGAHRLARGPQRQAAGDRPPRGRGEAVRRNGARPTPEGDPTVETGTGSSQEPSAD